MATGEMMYCDSDYAVLAIPDFLDGIDLIRTAMVDKRSDATDEQFMCFELTAPATVYVLYDSRVTNGMEPTWLQRDFTEEDQFVVEVGDIAMGTMTSKFTSNPFCL